MLIKFSIIVPIYNIPFYKGKNLLKKCIDSLINQTYQNIEIILVNDGSTDNTIGLCNDFSVKDKRVIVINKLNEGNSEARNIGIRNATGDFILFLDSDDYIDEISCEKFSEVIAEHPSIDTIVTSHQLIKDSRKRTMRTTVIDKDMNSKDFFKLQLKNNTWCEAPWAKVFRRSFLIENNLFFERHHIAFEDVYWNRKVFFTDHKTISIDFIHYYHLLRPESISNTKKSKQRAEFIISLCYEFEEMYNTIKDDELKTLLLDKLLSDYLSALIKSGYYKNKVDEKLLKHVSYHRLTRLRVWLFNFNPIVYKYIYKLYNILILN